MQREFEGIQLGGTHHDRSAELLNAGLAVIPGGMARIPARQLRTPIFYERGGGAIVTDVDGNNYIDFVNNYTSLIHGHGYAPVTKALQRQLELGISFNGPTQSEITLASLIVARNPSFDGVRFMNSGTEAVMYAIKAARALTGRVKIAKFEGGFHGAYDPAQASFDARPDNWGDAAQPNPVGYCQGTPNADLTRTIVLPFNDLAVTKSLLEAHREDLAAVLIDPLPQSVGLMPIDADYLDFLRAFTSRHGIVLVSDEVMSFRLTPAGGLHPYGIDADLCAFGKVIGGGMPIGAVAGPARFMSVFDSTAGKPRVPQSGTFSGNPMSMVAGTAALQGFGDTECKRLNSLGEYARQRLTELFASRQWPYCVTGAGSMLRLHLREILPRNFRETFMAPERRQKMSLSIELLQTNGVLVTPTCQFCLSTPMTKDHIDEMVRIVEASIAQLHAE